MTRSISLHGQTHAAVAHVYADLPDQSLFEHVICPAEGTESLEWIKLGLFENLPLGVAIFDQDGGLAHANAYFASRIALPHLPSRAVGGTLRWHGWTGDGRPLEPTEFPCHRAFNGQTVNPGLDLLHLGKDGSRLWLNVSAAPIRDPLSNDVIGIVLLALEIREQPSGQAVASAVDDQLRQLADQSCAAIWIVDAATRRFRYRNARHLGLTTSGSAVVRVAYLADWMNCIDELDRAAAAFRYEAVLDGSVEQHQYRLRGPNDAASRRVRESAFPIRDDNGVVSAICGITEYVESANDYGLVVIGDGRDYYGNSAAAGDLSIRCTRHVASIESFLQTADFGSCECVLVDLNTAEGAQEHLMQLLAECRSRLPIVVIGAPDTTATTAITAMRAGAMDYLIPPFTAGELERALQAAARRHPRRCAEPAAASSADARMVGLSDREHEVLAGLRAGGTNKSIGRDLGISPRTVESHRSRLMERMNARNLAELLQTTR